MKITNIIMAIVCCFLFTLTPIEAKENVNPKEQTKIEDPIKDMVSYRRHHRRPRRRYRKPRRVHRRPHYRRHRGCFISTISDQSNIIELVKDILNTK